MKLFMQIDLGPRNIVLDGDPTPPPPKGHSPQFSVHICCGQMAGCIKMPLGIEVGLGAGDFVLHGDAVWCTPANFNGFRVLAAFLYGTLVVGVSQTLRR